jgi:hypothetical protein
MLTHELVSHARFASSPRLFVPARSFFQHNGVPLEAICVRASLQMNVFFSHTSALLTQRGQAAYISCSFCVTLFALKLLKKLNPLIGHFAPGEILAFCCAQQTFFCILAYALVLLNS